MMLTVGEDQAVYERVRQCGTTGMLLFRLRIAAKLAHRGPRVKVVPPVHRARAVSEGEKEHGNWNDLGLCFSRPARRARPGTSAAITQEGQQRGCGKDVQDVLHEWNIFRRDPAGPYPRKARLPCDPSGTLPTAYCSPHHYLPIRVAKGMDRAGDLSTGCRRTGPPSHLCRRTHG